MDVDRSQSTKARAEFSSLITMINIHILNGFCIEKGSTILYIFYLNVFSKVQESRKTFIFIVGTPL